MPVFYNRSTGKQDFVSESEALEKLESTHGVPLEEEFQLTDSEGTVWNVPGKNLSNALRMGGRFSTQEEVKEVDDRHKYGEGTLNELKALGLGVARGATLNLSDIAFAKTGMIEAETIKGLEKYNPAASITGEITGNIAGLAIPGATPVKLAAKLGRAVETGITGAKAVEAGAQASRAAKILRSGVGIGAGSAIEAAAYGVGEYVSETALGDPEANAEKILAAATLGGTVGIGFRMGGAAFSKGKEFLTKSKKPDLDSGRLPVISPEDALAAKNTMEELSGLDAPEVFTVVQQKMARMSAIHAALQAKTTIKAASQGKIPFVDFKSFFNVIGTASQEIGSDALALSNLERKFSMIDQDIVASVDEFIKPTMGQRLVGMAASVTGADQAAIKEVINNPELIRLAQMSDADWYKRALEFRDLARDVHKSIKTLSKSIVFEMKPQKVREVLADVDLDIPQGGAIQYFEAVRKSLREMDADSNIYKDTGTVASLKKILRNSLGQSDDDLLFTSNDSIADMVNAGTLKGGKFFEKKTAADVFLYMDEFKRDTLTGEINKKILSGGDLSSLHHDILRTQLRVKNDIYDKLGDMLENDQVFPVMGTWQQRINKDISSYMDALDFYEQKFMQDQGGKYVISTDRIKSFLNDPKGVRFISSGSKFEAYEGFKNAQPNIIKLAEELFPESKKLEAAKIAQKGHEALDEAIKKAEAEREIRSNAWNGHLAAHTELTPEGREAYRRYVDKAQDVIALKDQKKIGFKADGTPKEAPKPKAQGGKIGFGNRQKEVSPELPKPREAEIKKPLINPQVSEITQTKEKQIPSSEVAEKPLSWKEFTGQRMGKYMKELGGHAPAIKKIAEEWKAYKEGLKPGYQKPEGAIGEKKQAALLPFAAVGGAGGLGMLATDYLEDQQSLAEASTNPESLINALSENMAGFGKAAPKTTALVQQKAWQAMQFLQEKAPSNPLSGQYLGVAPKWRPSDQDVARFERYLNATDNPLVILEELRAGTVHTETVETVKTLYPLLYQQIQEKMLEALSNRAEPLPYKKTLILSRLLGVPGDPTTQPQFIAQLQAMHTKSENEQNKQDAIKQSQKQSRLAQSSATRFQSLSRS